MAEVAAGDVGAEAVARVRCGVAAAREGVRLQRAETASLGQKPFGLPTLASFTRCAGAPSAAEARACLGWKP